MTVVYIVVKISIVYVHLSRISTQPYLMKAAADERNRSPRQLAFQQDPRARIRPRGPVCHTYDKLARERRGNLESGTGL